MSVKCDRLMAQRQNRLLILGTQFEFVNLVKKSKARGYYTVVCDGYEDGPARAFADRAYVRDVRDIEWIAELCAREKIDRIITSFSDIMFECMVKIAAKAGIPCYVAEEKLVYYRRKEKTKEICRELGIPVPGYRLLKPGFLPEEIETFRYPCILKPVDSYGSRGLCVVHRPQEVLKKYEEVMAYSAGEALLEELMQGQELNCMSCIVDGNVKLISIADRMTVQWDESRIPLNYSIRYPSAAYELVKEQVTNIFQRYANAMEQKWGPLSMQCFYHDGIIEVCEIAGRFFGFEHEMVEYYSGLDLENLLLDLAFDPAKAAADLNRHDPAGRKVADCIYIHSIREGILAGQESLDEIAEDPCVKDSVLFYREGETVGILGPKQYFARYYIALDNREDMIRKEDEILNRASAKDILGQELLFHCHEN